MGNSAEQEMQVSVQSGVVTVQVGKLHFTVPAQRVADLAKAFNAAHILVGVTSPEGGLATSDAPEATSGAPSGGVPASKRRAPRGRSEPVPAAPVRGKRRSRKRVGVALAAWLAEHPGWYTEAELLDLVIREKMSDAEPNRALKIALGKQRDTFEQDEAGRWRLRPTVSAAEPETPKRGRGRPKGSGLKKRPVAGDGAEPALPSPVRGRARAAAAPERGNGAANGEAPERRKPGRPKGSGLKRTPPSDRVLEAVEAPKPVRVKRGQRRDEVVPRGRGGKESASAELDVDRIRRNLFSEPAV
jgi:hypothetical protein